MCEGNVMAAAMAEEEEDNNGMFRKRMENQSGWIARNR